MTTKKTRTKEGYERTALAFLKAAAPDPAEEESVIWRYNLTAALVYALLAVAQAIDNQEDNGL